MGGETTTSRAVVQSAGHGYHLNAKLLKEEFQRSGPMLHLLLRYTQALITQMPLAVAEPGSAAVEPAVHRRRN